jgi:hypothetical protein
LRTRIKGRRYAEGDRCNHEKTGGIQSERLRHDRCGGSCPCLHNLNKANDRPEGKGTRYHRDHARKRQANGWSAKMPRKSLGEETHGQCAGQRSTNYIHSQMQAQGPQGVARYPARSTGPGDPGRNIEEEKV